MFLETLESRRLLSISFNNGVVTLVGTNGADYFDARYDGVTLKLYDQGRYYDFKASKVKKIVVKAKDGIDNITFRNVPAPISCVVKAGDGNDNVNGGEGNDKLYGGKGNDLLEGYFGTDKIYGQDGNDKLYDSPPGYDPATTGKDRLFGGAGRDIFYTVDEGKDIIDGGSGRDTLDGDDKEDYVDIERFEV